MIALIVILCLVGIVAQNSATAETLKVENAKDVVVYKEDGRFGGWPANHGMWHWGDEVLVGFSRGYYKNLGERHHIDRDKPEQHWLARSLDGGKTWKTEDPQEKGMLIPQGEALHGTELPEMKPVPAKDCPGGIDFTNPDFAMTLRMSSADTGESRFYYSYDRGHTWEGPFKLPLFGQKGIMARTDYIVNGKHDCMIFLTAAKENNEEGRVLSARTQDGGKTWKMLSFIGPEPEGFSIMPSTVRLSDTKLICTTRRREGDNRWIDGYVSEDNGESWEYIGKPVKDCGIGNPPAMIQLQDGRLCLTYGFRQEPWEMRAVFSSDEGKTWTEPYTIRTGGGTRDLGYPRTVQLPDGKILTAYYWCDQPDTERYIAATIWEAPAP
ncbi:MAG: exo-alpha-sialidase [Candidatus Omnitrophica bacterium]|nr:exo-alpha-sialidase [Candidatus Omnitrophota bacterium]